MSGPRVIVEKVTIRYQRKFSPVVKNVTFTLNSHEIVMLIGPNGSGKTTLLKSLVGLIPYEGKITLTGNDPKSCTLPVGYVPQTHTVDLTFPVTVREFLSISHAGCLTRGRAAALNALEMLGAGKLKSKRMNELSGGQLQRVLLARALMHEPKILVLDEPESGIDVGGEETLYELLVKLKNQGMSIILATHEIDTAHHYADRVICLNRELLCIGKPSEVLKNETLHHLYGHHRVEAHSKEMLP